MSDHTPDTETVIDCFLDGAEGNFLREDFYAWLESVKQEAKDKALRHPTELRTAEELDALPEGAVVIGHDFSAFRKVETMWQIDDDLFFSAEVIDGFIVHLVRLPAENTADT